MIAMPDREGVSSDERVSRCWLKCDRMKVILLGLLAFIILAWQWYSAYSKVSRKFANLYSDDNEVLIEPSGTWCESVGVSLLVLVDSAPSNAAARRAIRLTWGKDFDPIFVMGVASNNTDMLEAMNIEAKFNDIVVYDFIDEHQNQTLKTMLMLKWMHRRCPRAGAVLRVPDHVLVNPLAMSDVLKAHPNADLIGYKFNQSISNVFLSKWLVYEDGIPEYLSGAGYIIKGNQIERIIEAAGRIPSQHPQEVFFTYTVAKAGLGLILDHDSRLSPYKPPFPIKCAYRGLASFPSLTPDEMLKVWLEVDQLVEQGEEGVNDCQPDEFSKSRLLDLF